KPRTLRAGHCPVASPRTGPAASSRIGNRCRMRVVAFRMAPLGVVEVVHPWRYLVTAASLGGLSRLSIGIPTKAANHAQARRVVQCRVDGLVPGGDHWSPLKGRCRAWVDRVGPCR